jgi:hypothetical protein
MMAGAFAILLGRLEGTPGRSCVLSLLALLHKNADQNKKPPMVATGPSVTLGITGTKEPDKRTRRKFSFCRKNGITVSCTSCVVAVGLAGGEW